MIRSRVRRIHEKFGISKNVYGRRKTPQNVLGISENATKDEAKVAYRELALKYHPDRKTNPTKEDAEKFHEIQSAYDEIMGRNQAAEKITETPNHEEYRQNYQKNYQNTNNRSYQKAETPPPEPIEINKYAMLGSLFFLYSSYTIHKIRNAADPRHKLSLRYFLNIYFATF